MSLVAARCSSRLRADLPAEIDGYGAFKVLPLRIDGAVTPWANVPTGPVSSDVIHFGEVIVSALAGSQLKLFGVVDVAEDDGDVERF